MSKIIAISGNAPTEWFEPISQEDFENIDVAGIKEKALVEHITQISKDKWQWMADKEADKLADLFHEKAKFVHMGGTWGKDREVNVIRSGDIHYKQADIHEVSVEVMGDMAIVWNRIMLLAVVGGNEVTNPFMVTEVYIKENNDWKLADLTFSKLLTRD